MENTTQDVNIRNIDMSFSQLAGFQLKVALSSIPALIVFSFVWGMLNFLWSFYGDNTREIEK